MRKATTTLLAKLNIAKPTAQQLFEEIFNTNAPYDSICICALEWNDEEPSQMYGTFFTREQINLIIYSYVVKRATAISLIEREGTRICNNWVSATDAAFVELTNAFLNFNRIGPDLDLPDINAHGRVLPYVSRSTDADSLATRACTDFYIPAQHPSDSLQDLHRNAHEVHQL